MSYINQERPRIRKPGSIKKEMNQIRRSDSFDEKVPTPNINSDNSNTETEQFLSGYTEDPSKILNSEGFLDNPLSCRIFVYAGDPTIQSSRLLATLHFNKEEKGFYGEATRSGTATHTVTVNDLHNTYFSSKLMQLIDIVKGGTAIRVKGRTKN